MASPIEIENLERVVLKLPDITSNSGDSYSTALKLQAVPVVDLLAQINDAGVKRSTPALAAFGSERGREDFFTTEWIYTLGIAITDLSFASGLMVKVGHSRPGFNMIRAAQFKRLLPLLDLPPALQGRIESRKVNINTALDTQIAEYHRYLRRLSSFSSDFIPRNKPDITRSYDFQLSIRSTPDRSSNGNGSEKAIYPYYRALHTISLVS